MLRYLLHLMRRDIFGMPNPSLIKTPYLSLPIQLKRQLILGIRYLRANPPKQTKINTRQRAKDRGVIKVKKQLAKIDPSEVLRILGELT